MKKILLSLAGVAALSCSVNASAVTLNAASANAVTTTTCTLLDENVSINMSKDVTGSVICDTDVNGVGVATCHVAGLKTGTDGNIWRVSSLGGSIGVAVLACGTPTAAATATATEATTASTTAVGGS